MLHIALSDDLKSNYHPINVVLNTKYVPQVNKDSSLYLYTHTHTIKVSLNYNTQNLEIC